MNEQQADKIIELLQQIRYAVADVDYGTKYDSIPSELRSIKAKLAETQDKLAEELPRKVRITHDVKTYD